MKICKLCESEIKDKNLKKYCQSCRQKWKRPRERYYYINKKSKKDGYKEQAIQRTQKWAKNNPKKYKKNIDKQTEKLKFIKQSVLKFYGENEEMKCVQCRCHEHEALTLDHVNNDGYKDEKEQSSIYRDAYNIRDKNIYQTLCYNCNWKKFIKYSESIRNKTPKSNKAKEKRMEIKQRCISHYSNKTCQCLICGNNDIDVLCLDHIKNDGNNHRKEIYGKNQGGSNIYRWAIKNNFPDIFQVLCLNCNILKYRKIMNDNYTQNQNQNQNLRKR